MAQPTQKHAQYFEAIMQLRTVSPTVIDFAHQEIKKKGLFIAKLVHLHQGEDLYLSDNKFAKNLGKKLQQQFAGYLEITATLHTRKQDKDMYRLTVLFRGVPFEKGRLVRYQGEAYQVKSLGDDILLVGTENKKKIHVKWRDSQRIMVADNGIKFPPL